MSAMKKNSPGARYGTQFDAALVPCSPSWPTSMTIASSGSTVIP
nr:MAG TPA: hypothetical protein [Caudoviricetes sp.]